MSRTKVNIIANFAGRFVAAVLSIVFVPIYLHYLSVEMYGIIGFFTSIQSFLFLLDGGVSPTLNREVARLSAIPEKSQELRDLSRSLETVCWAVGLIVCIIALIAAPIAASYWLKSDTIPMETIKEALMIMSVSLLFQWAAAFYMGGMYGLQEQKLLNAVNAVLAIIRSFGAFSILAFVSPTITAFLIWQLIASILNCFVLAVLFWKKLPKSAEKPRFRSKLLKQVWGYAAGMAGIGLTTLFLTQTDKIVLSKILTLENFGYYTLAFTLAATGIGMIIDSVQTTYFPQFSQLVARNKIEEMRKFYHRACQVMSFFLIPAVAIISFYSYEILLIWTKKPEIAENTYILLTLIAMGMGMNGLMHLPYYAQLAFGITKIGFWQNVLSIIVLIPLMIYATLHYGAVGGAVTWVIINFSPMIIGLQIMHRIVLKGELKKWYLDDVLKPVFAVATFLFLAKHFINLENATTFYMFVVIGILFATTVCITAFTLPAIRENFLFYLKKTLARLNYGI